MSEIIIRRASGADAAQIVEIYRPYVLRTAITFDYEVPSVEEYRGRIERTLAHFPFLVAEEGGRLLGYAYTGVFKDRAAYDRSVETTIYLREDAQGRGLGRRLYEALENVSRAQNVLNLYACISFPEEEDGYLTFHSAEFHAHMGYRLIGEFHSCGYKFGKWYNMIWMEKLIGGHGKDPAEVTAFAALTGEELAACGVKA